MPTLGPESNFQKESAVRSAVLFLGFTVTAAAFAAGPCPHPYFPLEDGLELKYRAGKEDISARFTEAKQTADSAQAKMTVKVGAKGKEGSTLAICNAQGLGTESGGLGVVALQSSGLDVKITESEGILLPTPDALKSGQPWTNKVSIEMTPPDTVKMPMGMKPIIRTTFKADATYVAEEKVTTPAGTFDAIKIRNLTTAVAGATGSERSLESFIWFASGVGLVKVMTGDHVDLELVEIQRPAQAKNDAAATKK